MATKKAQVTAWALKTPSGTSEYEARLDEAASPPALVVQVGKTQLQYAARWIDDVGSADEQKPAAPGTVEVEHNAKNNRMRALGRKA